MTAKDDSWVLITGASSGLGEEFSLQYAAQGRPLILVARRLEKLHTLARGLRECYHVEVIVEQVDLSSISAVEKLHQRLCARGIAIGILINNAGHGWQGPLLDESLERPAHRRTRHSATSVQEASSTSVELAERLGQTSTVRPAAWNPRL